MIEVGQVYYDNSEDLFIKIDQIDEDMVYFYALDEEINKYAGVLSFKISSFEYCVESGNLILQNNENKQ